MVVVMDEAEGNPSRRRIAVAALIVLALGASWIFLHRQIDPVAGPGEAIAHPYQHPCSGRGYVITVDGAKWYGGYDLVGQNDQPRVGRLTTKTEAAAKTYEFKVAEFETGNRVDKFYTSPPRCDLS